MVRGLLATLVTLLLAFALPGCGSRSGLAFDPDGEAADASVEPFIDPCWDPALDWKACEERSKQAAGAYYCGYIFDNVSQPLKSCLSILQACPASCAPGFICLLITTPIAAYGPTLVHACAPCAWAELYVGGPRCPPDSGAPP